MLWSRLGPRERKLAVVVGVGAALLLGDRLFVRPLTGRMGGLGRQVDRAAQTIIRNRQTLRQREEIMRAFAAYQQQVQGDVSDEAAMVGLISAIEQVVGATGVSNIQFKPGASREADGYRQFDVVVSFNSSMESLMRFMHAVESSPQLLRVEELRLTARESTLPDVRCEVVVTKILFSG